MQSAEKVGAERPVALVQGHRRIEALHQVRDGSFGKNVSRVRSGRPLQNMAMPRNLAAPILTELALSSIPEAIRWAFYGAFIRPLHMLEVPWPARHGPHLRMQPPRLGSRLTCVLLIKSQLDGVQQDLRANGQFANRGSISGAAPVDC
ncbi:hypothetical protein GCM10026982_05330 [Nocardiopsis aegyptia]